MTPHRLEEIRRIAQSKEFSPETADQILSELIAHADATLSVSARERETQTVPRGTNPNSIP